MSKIEVFRGFSLGLLMGLLTVVGCASAGFPWRYYNTNMPDSCYDQGKLLGKEGKDGWQDLTLDQCKPDPDPSPGASPGPAPVKLKCITVLVDDFYSIKADDLKCHQALQDCQNPPPSAPGKI